MDGLVRYYRTERGMETFLIKNRTEWEDRSKTKNVKYRTEWEDRSSTQNEMEQERNDKKEERERNNLAEDPRSRTERNDLKKSRNVPSPTRRCILLC